MDIGADRLRSLRIDSAEVIRVTLITCLWLWAFGFDIVEDIYGGPETVPRLTSEIGYLMLGHMRDHAEGA